MALEHSDVVVIGAGQAGLAMGRQLQSLTCGVQIFERNARIGDSWRNRFDSLALFSPRELTTTGILRSCRRGLSWWSVTERRGDRLPSR